MRRRLATLAALALTFPLLVTCDSNRVTRPQPLDRRVLSIYASPPFIPPPTSADYVAAADLVHGIGSRGWFMAYAWNALEPTQGKRQLDDLRRAVDFAARQRGLTVLLGIQLINTVKRELPADLQQVRFDTPQMKARFHALVDAIAPIIRGRVAFLSIGNEVDFYLDYLDQFGGWPAYRDFYADAVAYIHAKIPDVRVGVTVTYHGASTTSRESIRSLASVSDVAIFTFYPIDGRSYVTSAASIDTVLPTMVALAEGKPVLVQELGFPTAARVGGSEADQAHFVRIAFARWTSIAPEQMPFVNFFHVHDFSNDYCEFLAGYYGDRTNEDVIAFLCSLGLRQADGAPKPGWDAFVAGARNAGLP